MRPEMNHSIVAQGEGQGTAPKWKVTEHKKLKPKKTRHRSRVFTDLESASDHNRMGMTTYRAALLSGSSTRALLLLSPISSSAWVPAMVFSTSSR